MIWLWLSVEQCASGYDLSDIEAFLGGQSWYLDLWMGKMLQGSHLWKQYNLNSVVQSSAFVVLFILSFKFTVLNPVFLVLQFLFFTVLEIAYRLTPYIKSV